MAREMKDSGVAWIGEIPADWQIVKFSRIASVKCNLVAPDDYLDLPQISPESIEKGSGKLLSYKTVEEAGIISGNHLFHEGQLLYSKIRPKLNKVCIAPFSGLCSADMYPIESNQNIRFLMYCMLSDAFVGQVSMITGDRVKMPKINQDELSSLLLAFPPTHSEQQVIANFLDTKCTEIDAVLEKTRTSIEEYKKLKQAIITQAVTKGVRGDRPMKESGIEWVPIVPNDWLVCKTLYCLNMPITDGPHITPELYDEGIPFVSAEAVSCGDGVIDFSHIRGYVSAEFYADCCKKYVPEIDDIYMIKSGATTGKVAIVDTDRIFTIWSPLAVFRCNRSITLPKYMFYFLQSIPYQKQIELGWSYGTQQNIGMRTLERLKVCLPPLDEQKEIVEYLNDMFLEIDLSIKKKEKMLSELEAYKKSLIYEYVTGKKEAL